MSVGEDLVALTEGRSGSMIERERENHRHSESMMISQPPLTNLQMVSVTRFSQFPEHTFGRKTPYFARVLSNEKPC